MLMNQKQIVTFELSTKDITFEPVVSLMRQFGTINTILDLYKHAFDELLIIRTTNLLIFYTYTNDYSPLIQLFESHGIPIRNYKMLVNTTESRIHLHSLFNHVYRKSLDKEQVLTRFKEAYRASRDNQTLGPILDGFVREVIVNHRSVRRESLIGKLSIGAVSTVMDTIKKKSKTYLEFDQSESTRQITYNKI